MNRLGLFLTHFAAPTPQPAPVVGTPAPTPVPSTGGTTLSNFNFWGLVFQYWYISLIIIVVVFFLARYGINKGWAVIERNHNINGDPFPPLSFTLQRLRALMYKEDIYPVFLNPQTGYSKTPNFTWKKFWTIDTIAVVAAVLSFLILPPAVSGSLLALFIIIGLFGVKHLRFVFGIRHRLLMQMFEVANAELRFDRGAELNPWAYIKISGWENVYEPQTTTIMFPAKFNGDSEIKRKAFEKHFIATVIEEKSWTFKWSPADNSVKAEPVPLIEKEARYIFPDPHPWNEFPLGVSSGGAEAIWDVSTYPHCLIAGTTGSGKSVTQRTMLLHALQSPDWRIVLVDPKRVELSGYRGHPNVLRVATELEDSLDLIDQVEREMQSRYVRMQEAGETQGRQVSHFKDLTSPPPALLLMVDETFALLAPSGIKSEEGKLMDEQKARIGILLGQIARLGRAAGVHMILATQRPDAKVLPGEVKANLDARIAQGRMDTTPSLMTLDSDAATQIPPIKGRAILRTGQVTTEFQAYFLPPDQLPMVLEMAAAIAQGDTSFLDNDLPEMAPEPSGFSLSNINLPKINLPHGLQARLSAWVEKRKAVIAENEEQSQPGARRKKASTVETTEAPAQRPPRPRPQPVYVPPVQDFNPFEDDEEDFSPFEPSEAEKIPDISSVAQHAKERGFSAEPVDLFVQADAPRVHANYTAPDISTIPLEDYDEDPFTDEDLAEFDDPDFVPTQTSDPAPVTPPANIPQEPSKPIVSVQEVMRRAQQRGVPIPASELLAALRAEVERDEAAKAAAQTSAQPQNVNDQEDDEILEPEPGSAAYYQLHKDDLEDEWENEEPLETPTPIVMERPAPVRPDPKALPTIPAPPVMPTAENQPVVETVTVTPNPVLPEPVQENTLPLTVSQIPVAAPVSPFGVQQPPLPPAPPARLQEPSDESTLQEPQPQVETPKMAPRAPRRPSIVPTQLPLPEIIPETQQPVAQTPTIEQSPQINASIEEDTSWDEAPWMPKTIIQPRQAGPSPFGLPQK